MWSKQAHFLIVRVKLQDHRGFALPVSLYVVDELFEAIADLAWLGEIFLRKIPSSKEEHARKHLNWIKVISPSGVIIGLHSMIKDLKKHQGLNVVEVNTGDVKVKIHLR